MLANSFLFCFAIVSLTSAVPTAISTLERGGNFTKRSLKTRGGCRFDDRLLLKSTIGSQSSSLERSAVKITDVAWFYWIDHENRIPYFFRSSVKEMDKKVIQRAMSKVSAETCITFKEVPHVGLAPSHHLDIYIENQAEDCREDNGGAVDHDEGSAGKVTMFFTHSFQCGGKPREVNLVLHELGHVLGLVHTHKRPDRKKFVKINKKCIIELEEDMAPFDRLKWKEIKTCGVPYKCNSMMHYEGYEFSKYNGCDTISAKPGKCEKGMGGGAIKEDWDLINLVHCIPCHSTWCTCTRKSKIH